MCERENILTNKNGDWTVSPRVHTRALHFWRVTVISRIVANILRHDDERRRISGEYIYIYVRKVKKRRQDHAVFAFRQGNIYIVTLLPFQTPEVVSL